MNKKTIMTSMVAVFVGSGAYANTVDIDADGNRLNSNPAVAANCTEPILGTYSGSTDFEAKWQANSIPLHWYKDNEEMDVTGEPAASCTYDAGLTVPATQPSKRGYHFRGWTIRTASSGGNSGSGNSGSGNTGNLCGLTTASVASIELASMRMKDLNGNGYYSSLDRQILFNSEGVSGFDSVEINDLSNGEWEITDTNGNKYKGISACTDTDMNRNYDAIDELLAEWEAEGLDEGEMICRYYTTGNADRSSNTFTAGTIEGRYCWCKATSYTPNGNAECSLVSKHWIMDGDGDRSDEAACARICTAYCMMGVGEEFLANMFVCAED